MTQQQRKVLLISLGIVVGSFVVHSIVNSLLKLEYMRQQEIQRAKKAKQKPSPMPPPDDLLYTFMTKPVEPRTIDAKKLLGVWQGKAVLDQQGRGICDLRLEIKESAPDRYYGYSTFSCVNVADVTAFSISKNRVDAATNALHAMRQDSAIFNGTMESGAIHFTLDKAIGASANGCAVTAITITPFGANQVAAEWQEKACRGGSILLQRAR